MISCNDLKAHLGLLMTCESTDQGLLVSTSCLYPSFEMVKVIIRSHGDGFIVSDGGEGSQIALAHGQSDHEISKHFKNEAHHFGVHYNRSECFAQVETSDWLASAVLSVANASSNACKSAIEKARKDAEIDVIGNLFDRLQFAKVGADLVKEFEATGQSGRQYNVDVAAIHGDQRVFFEIVGSHQNSVNSKFVMFSDVGRSPANENVAVYSEALNFPDQVLLQTVAMIAPLNGIESMAKNRFLSHG
ncbi:hypothetical protein ACFQ14_04420 [Pseudahrensia aquimaris]|uniref:DUF1828 domain-containing protein n=1 Tax=Pseudahrensia aquimaris TaxID=744461 RepID=A0ABW3FGZ0_9HYPH